MLWAISKERGKNKGKHSAAKYNSCSLNTSHSDLDNHSFQLSLIWLLYLLLMPLMMLLLIFRVLQKLYLLNNSCTSEIAEALGGGEKERAKGAVLLLEFFCICKPLRLYWQRTPAGISHFYTRYFADWIMLVGDIARIWHSCYFRTAHWMGKIVLESIYLLNT